jgi:AraC family transcriptional regulator
MQVPCECDMTQYQSLFRSDLVSVDEHSCHACKSGWSCELGGEPASILFVRRGCFAVRGRIEVVADPFSALIYDGDHSYRVRRPVDGGDAVTRIVPNAELMDEALGKAPIHVPVSPAVHLLHLRLYARAKAANADPLDVEEAAADLLHQIARLAGNYDEPRPGPARRRVAEARALLAASPQADHRLSDLARVAGCSPFHLARLFKEETGLSVRAYRLRLRLALAIDLLAEGAHDLTTLAMDTGFSHHSHMTTAFKKVLGKKPSAVRDSLARSSTFLKASLSPAA